MPIASRQRGVHGPDVWQAVTLRPHELAGLPTAIQGAWPMGEARPRVASVTARVTDFGADSSGGVRDLVRGAGADVALAYGGFAVCALFLTFAQATGKLDGSKSTLLGVLSGSDWTPGGFGWFLILAALGSIAATHFWKHPCAVLAATTPLLITLYADLRYAEAQVGVVYVVTKAMLDRASALGDTGAITADMLTQSAATDPYRIGLGAFATLILATYIALRGAQRFGRPAVKRGENT